MPKARETVLEIDLNALAHNYNYIRSKIDKDVKFMAVVKAFGYGSDVTGIAQKLVELGADYFAVAYTSEGIALREAGIETPILVLHPQSANFEAVIDHCLEPSLYSEFVLDEFIKTAEKQQQKNYPVHIKFNTGLNRLGFSEKETSVVRDLLKRTSAVKATSFFSHLAASEDWREREFTLMQIHTFRKIAVKLYDELGYRPLLHICNTSGVINYPKAHFDMIRSGIGLYGFGNDESEDQKLKPIGTLKTIVSQIHTMEKGETLGYNRAFTAEKTTRTATLPIGHADGINRQYGNGRAGVFINGKYAPIIGNVCMDMVMVDITGIDCKEGDEVIIFGGPQHATEFAAKGNTISYELITGISQRVKRILINN
ncbi:alanine racemase [Salinimicrobium sp. TH3]|uniref:alanine racemase n=1 Tax=Salinimicrobium sp. TH3 TaxID=2997342 RepID=UPI0022750929|nr:alanine racemase [Salinimicrobium sp. TH3]MCY2686462.1 alanine racemase [Salinimicrobium sp. TH3]